MRRAFSPLYQRVRTAVSTGRKEGVLRPEDVSFLLAFADLAAILETPPYFCIGAVQIASHAISHLNAELSSRNVQGSNGTKLQWSPIGSAAFQLMNLTADIVLARHQATVFGLGVEVEDDGTFCVLAHDERGPLRMSP